MPSLNAHRIAYLGEHSVPWNPAIPGDADRAYIQAMRPENAHVEALRQNRIFDLFVAKGLKP